MASTVVRHPAVAGQFYPGGAYDLRAEAQRLSLIPEINERIPVAGDWLHRSACRVYVFRPRGGSRICPH